MTYYRRDSRLSGSYTKRLFGFCTKEKFDYEKEFSLTMFLPGTHAAEIYNKFVETADRYFGRVGLSMVKKFRCPFEVLENFEYKRILKNTSDQ